MRNEVQPSSDDILTTDTIFDVLSHSHRRTLLAILHTHDQPQAIADIARAIAERTHGAPLDEIPGETIERIEASLHHIHIPKLQAVDSIVFNPDRNVLALTERGEQLCAVMDHLIEWVAQLQADE